jgi:hypothetical protein
MRPALSRRLNRIHLKNVFWPNIFVGASVQILDIHQYASGLKLGPAAILNQNPIFEMGSIDRAGLRKHSKYGIIIYTFDKLARGPLRAEKTASSARKIF